MAKKEARDMIVLVCPECGYSRQSEKNRTNDPERLVISLHCPNCRKHQEFKEKK